MTILTYKEIRSLQINDKTDTAILPISNEIMRRTQEKLDSHNYSSILNSPEYFQALLLHNISLIDRTLSLTCDQNGQWQIESNVYIGSIHIPQLLLVLIDIATEIQKYLKLSMPVEFFFTITTEMFSIFNLAEKPKTPTEWESKISKERKYCRYIYEEHINIENLFEGLQAILQKLELKMTMQKDSEIKPYGESYLIKPASDFFYLSYNLPAFSYAPKQTTNFLLTQYQEQKYCRFALKTKSSDIYVHESVLFEKTKGNKFIEALDDFNKNKALTSIDFSTYEYFTVKLFADSLYLSPKEIVLAFQQKKINFTFEDLQDLIKFAHAHFAAEEDFYKMTLNIWFAFAPSDQHETIKQCGDLYEINELKELAAVLKKKQKNKKKI